MAVNAVESITLGDLIREMNSDLAYEERAAEIIDKVDEIGDTLILLPAVIAYLRTHDALLVHQTTRKVEFSSPRALEDRELRRELARVSVTDGSGRRHPWGQLTIEGHQAKIDHYRKVIGGFGDRITLHAMSIDLINKYKVSCLDEIDRTNLPKELKDLT